MTDDPVWTTFIAIWLVSALIVLGLFVRAGTGDAGTGDDPCKVPATTVPVELIPPVTECRGGC